MTTDTVRTAWQASATDARLPDLAELRQGADKFHRQIHRRNLIEYVACVFVVFGFTAVAIFVPSLMVRIGSVLIMLAAIFVAWQLHRRASAVTPPDGGAEPILVHQRAQLVRQRDALAQVGRWYLLPFVPGFALILLSPVIGHGWGALLGLDRGVWIRIAINPLVFAGVWWLNLRGARQLQHAIDDLDALGREP